MPTRGPAGLSALADDLVLAERMATAAGELLLERYDRPAEGVGSKSSATDMVSDADRAAEELIRDLLLAERPQDGLLAEEGASRETASGRRWVIDPLDGTTNFLYGFPAWAVSVALADDSGPAVGVVHDPLAGETFRAARGAGAELNGNPARVREPEELAQALVATGFGYEAGRRAKQARLLQTVLPRVRDIRRAGAAALDLAYVATGRLDGYYERGLKPWDWAAGSLLVAEAGGVVEELPGDPPGLVAGSRGLVDALAPLVS